MAVGRIAGGEAAGFVGWRNRHLGNPVYQASFYGVPLVALFGGLYLSSLYSNLLFHTLIEVSSISIAFALCMLTWSVREHLSNNYLKIVGIGFAIIGLIDLHHTIAYKGMNVFATEGANMATQFWLAGRYVQAATLLVAPLVLGRNLGLVPIIAVYSFLALGLIASIVTGHFPKVYEEGTGLTEFKITSEYVVIAILFAALFLLIRKRAFFDINVLRFMAAAIVVTALSEFAFASYADVSDLTNMIGHYLKFISYYFVYAAIFVIGVQKPLDLTFRELQQSKEQLHKTHDILEERVAERTSELFATNQQLTSEIAERGRAEEEKKQLEAHLIRAQKMDAVGQLAGGVAHDFNNILCAMIGFCALAKRKTSPDSGAIEFLDDILALTEKASVLTKGLLSFSRKQIVSMKPVNLNSAVIAFGKIIQRVIGDNIHLTIKPADNHLIIMADSGQIDQILMNLSANARDAMPAGGSLTISLELMKMDDSYIAAHGFGAPGRYALLSVSDTGIGMDKDTQAQIFDPFFTTKEPGKGTGLGLAIIYTIVKNHNGFINVYSEIGTGTTFRIFLPAVDMIVEQTAIAGSLWAGGSEIILLAEDDAATRRAARIILESAGYTVIEAVDGIEAIEQYSRHRNEIGLVVIDIIMPRKSGPAAYEEIAKLAPGVKVIFTSGYTSDLINAAQLLEEGLHFLSKPYSPGDLLREIRHALDKKEPALQS